MSDAPARCAHRRCRRKPVEAWDVGPSVGHRRAILRHYEVCSKHAEIFHRQWITDTQSAEIRRDYVPDEKPT